MRPRRNTYSVSELINNKTSMNKKVKLLATVDAFLDEASRYLNDSDCRKLEAMCTIIKGTSYDPMYLSAKQTKIIIDKLPVKEPEMENRNVYKTEVFFKQVLKRRLQHCNHQLIKNVDSNGFINASKTIAFFNDGTHFSQPVYEAISDSLNHDMDSWPSIIWQQIVRQMFIEHNLNNDMFNFATEHLLVCEN